MICDLIQAESDSEFLYLLTSFPLLAFCPSFQEITAAIVLLNAAIFLYNAALFLYIFVLITITSVLVLLLVVLECLKFYFEIIDELAMQQRRRDMRTTMGFLEMVRRREKEEAFVQKMIVRLGAHDVVGHQKMKKFVLNMERVAGSLKLALVSLAASGPYRAAGCQRQEGGLAWRLTPAAHSRTDPTHGRLPEQAPPRSVGDQQAPPRSAGDR